MSITYTTKQHCFNQRLSSVKDESGLNKQTLDCTIKQKCMVSKTSGIYPQGDIHYCIQGLS